MAPHEWDNNVKISYVLNNIAAFGSFIWKRLSIY